MQPDAIDAYGPQLRNLRSDLSHSLLIGKMNHFFKGVILFDNEKRKTKRAVIVCCFDGVDLEQQRCTIRLTWNGVVCLCKLFIFLSAVSAT